MYAGNLEVARTMKNVVAYVGKLTVCRMLSCEERVKGD